MSDENKGSEQEHVLGGGAGVYKPGAGQEIAADFGGFIVGLYQSAMVSLGQMEHPETGSTESDLEGARHTIEILNMLKVKTQGNLDEEESQLLKGLLYRLRVAYVEAKS